MIPRPAPITDSPLFWLLLFGSVGLVMLTAIEPKYIKRQERISRMQQTRERVHSAHTGADRPVEEEADRTSWRPAQRASLRPLMLFLVALLIAAMIVMQLRRQKAIWQYRQAVAAFEEGTHS
jgi:hypothetical protein